MHRIYAKAIGNSFDSFNYYNPAEILKSTRREKI